MPYYSTGHGYYTPTYTRRSTSFGINISTPGRNLIILMVLGLVIGFITSLFYVNNIQAIIFLLQDNYLVYHGWVPSLVTSIIVVSPNYLGVVDVLFNAIAIFFLDGLLRNTYTQKQYYLVFLLTGIAGNIVSLFGYGSGQGIINTTISFGASGGIFGLVAGAVTNVFAICCRGNMIVGRWLILI